MTTETSNIKAMPRRVNILDRYTQDQLLAAAHEMEAMGGHFAGCIAQAYFHADSYNKTRLLIAFQDLFEKFVPKGESNED